MRSLTELFALNLVLYREAMDLTQAHLAKRVRYSTGSISQFERGVRTPSLATVEHLAAALNVKDPRLMFADPAPTKKGRKP